MQAYPDETSDPVGVIVCKQAMHKDMINRGYIAMLSVHKDWRKRGIGGSAPLVCYNLTESLAASTLVRRSIEVMKGNGVEEVNMSTVDVHILTKHLSGRIGN